MSILHDALKKVETSGHGLGALTPYLGFRRFEPDAGTDAGNRLTALSLLLLAVALAWGYIVYPGRTTAPSHAASAGRTAARFDRAQTQPAAEHLKRGTRLYKAGRLDEAMAELKRALDADPGNRVIYNNIGVVHAARNDYALADEFFKKAAGLDPGYAEAVNNRGATALRLGRIEESITYFEKAIGINPGYAEAYLNAAAAYERAGDAEKAIAHYRSFIERGNSPEAGVDPEMLAQAGQKVTALTNAIILKLPAASCAGHPSEKDGSALAICF